MKHRKKQWFALLASLTLALSMLSMSAVSVMAESVPAPETGEEESSLTEENGECWIRTAADLNTFAAQVTSGNDFAGKVVNLDADITADSDYAGAGVYAINETNAKSFNGTLDGKDHTITLTLENSFASTSAFGVINDLGQNGVVKNLKVAGSVSSAATGSGNLYVGTIAGYNRGLISNCSSLANVTGTSTAYSALNIGGIIGSGRGKTENCISSGNVAGKYKTTANAVRIGGIAGEMYTGCIIDGCTYNGSSVSGDPETPTKICSAGGIVGHNNGGATAVLKNSTVEQCQVTGYYAGGIVGQTGGKILNNHSSAVVTGTKYTGGVAGYLANVNAVLRNNYFAGSFGESAVSVGGILGYSGSKNVAQNNYAADSSVENITTGSNVFAFNISTSAYSMMTLTDNATFDASGTLTWQDGASAIAPSDASGTALADTQPIAEVTTLLTALQTWQQNSEENAFKAWIAGSPYPVFASDSGEEPQTPAGDLDGDGVVGNSDVKLLQQVALGKATLTEEQLAAVDFNSDGKITASDVLHLKKLAMGKL